MRLNATHHAAAVAVTHRAEPGGGRALPRTPIRVALPVLSAAALGLAVTLLASGTTLLSFAYRSSSLHASVETAAALASIVAAQSIYGRFRSSLQLRDLVLTTSLAMFATVNLLFAAVPAVLSSQPGPFRTWAPVFGHLTATTLLVVAAFLPERVVHHPRRAAARALVALELAVGAIAALVVLLGDALSAGVPVSGGPAGHLHIVGDPVVVATQLISTALFAAAAMRFALRAARTRDPLMRWLAIATTLGGFARVNYFLFPSLYTEWFYAGDGLRLACFLALFAGGVQETRRLQRALAAAAVLEERARIARELHDGVAQDLAFVVQQLRRLGARPDAAVDLQALVRAAEGALDESRNAIAALGRGAGDPLGAAVHATAREAAEREGATVEVDVPAAVDVPYRTQQELLRVVREAVINAVRHGRARRIRVQVIEQPELCVSVIDDGIGFDATAQPRDGHFGLTGMAARVASIGGELSIRSEPGRGTEVRVTVP